MFIQTREHSHAPQYSYIYNGTVMPMMTTEASEQAKRDREAKQAETAVAEQSETQASEPVTEPEVTEAVAEAEAIAEAAAKPKRSRKRDKVAVA